MTASGGKKTGGVHDQTVPVGRREESHRGKNSSSPGTVYFG
jgi:hypothetical protein